MKRRDHVIVGIHVHDRARQALNIQNILGEFGHIIRTRLGMHELDEKDAAASGVIILELIGAAAAADELILKLRKCPGVQVKKLVFSHS